MRARITWRELAAVEPTAALLHQHLDALVAAYNHPHNATQLGHTAALDQEDVLDHYTRVKREGGVPFVLLCDDALAGDGDLRGISDGGAELAFLIAAPSQQGRGLGTRFALMITAFAFRGLELERVYASVLPANVASQRVFAKLGYTLDDSARARELADDGDLSLSIDRATFLAQHAGVLDEIVIVR